MAEKCIVCSGSLSKCVYAKSAEKELLEPVIGKIEGQLPSWIHGQLYRIGPGKFEFGNDHYEHWFDGCAMIQRYSINGKQVTLNCQLLKSDTFQQNTKAGKIVVSEFGTSAKPDPNKTIFQRYLHYYFQWLQLTDNTVVNVFPFSHQLFATTESNYWNRIDPVTLDRIDKVNISNYLAIQTATAHPHVVEDGTLYNTGYSCGYNGPHYVVFELPPNLHMTEALSEAKILTEIPARWKFNPSYHHCHGISENYIVFIETPVCFNIPNIVTSGLVGRAMNKCLTNYPDKTIFHVVQRKSGKYFSKYFAEGFFFFHLINVYEDDNHLIVDCCSYPDDQAIRLTRIDFISDPDYHTSNLSRPRRFILPLNISKQLDSSQNQIGHPNTSCRAHYDHKLGSVWLIGENLFDFAFEMPAIYYEKYNAKKYRFAYGLSSDWIGGHQMLKKIDCENRISMSWSERNCFPSEPRFIGRPDGTAEDDGVLLSVVIQLEPPTYHNRSCNRTQFLLVLDATDFTELARVHFPMASIPMTFHGIFISQK